MEKKYNHILMDKANLEKLSKSELINLVLNKTKTVPKMIRKPIPTPRKSVKDMIRQYEDNIISPPPEFRDKPIPLPRLKKIAISPPPEFRDKPIPIPAPRTKQPVPEKRILFHKLKKP